MFICRNCFHTEIYESLKPGGFLVLEAFAKEQIRFDSGGPKDAASICGDFPFLHILSCSQKEIKLDEGGFHKGKAAVLQLVGQRL